MTKRRREINLQINQLTDAVLLVAALWFSHRLRYRAPLYVDDLFSIPPFEQFLWLVAVIAPFGPLLLEMQGFYRTPTHKNWWQSAGQLFRAAAWLTAIIAGCMIFFRAEVPSRSVFGIFGVLAVVFLLVKERLVVMWLRSKWMKEGVREKVLLAGIPHDIRQMLDRLPESQLMQIEVVGQIDIEKQPISDLVAAMHAHSVGRVIFASGHLHLNRIQEAIAACETEGVEAWLLADFIRTAIARPTFDAFGEQPMLVFRTTPELSWALLIKGMMDFFAALAGILVLLPLLVVIAAAIRLTSPGPAIFRQMRGGRHGRPFAMLKFRSMYIDAEERKAELERNNQMSGPVFKMENDPRITPLGKILRKFSLDELPQLFNVLAGDMSLVGPRPLPVYEVARFENTAQRRRLSVKPGLTCLWQISGRNEVSDFQDWVRLDLEYIDNWSLWLDLKILCKTIPVVCLGAGAR